MSTVLYTSVLHCSLNFECPRPGYGFLWIILVLEKMQFGSLKVLEFCTLSLLRTLIFSGTRVIWKNAIHWVFFNSANLFPGGKAEESESET